MFLKRSQHILNSNIRFARYYGKMYSHHRFCCDQLALTFTFNISVLRCRRTAGVTITCDKINNSLRLVRYEHAFFGLTALGRSRKIVFRRRAAQKANWPYTEKKDRIWKL